MSELIFKHMGVLRQSWLRSVTGMVWGNWLMLDPACRQRKRS
jgi:hypothetical protein